MKKNHRIAALTLTGALALSLLAGCASSNAPGSSQPSGTSEPDSSTAAPAADVLSIADRKSVV